MTTLQTERIAALCEQLKLVRLSAEWPALAQDAARSEAHARGRHRSSRRLRTPGAQGRRVLAGGELHEGGAAVAHRGHQRDQRVTPAAHMREVGLHLLARRRLEADDGFGFDLLQRRQPRLQLADAAVVARSPIARRRTVAGIQRGWACSMRSCR